LEAEKGSVLAEFHLCSSPGVFLRLVENGLGIGFFGKQDVVQDTSDLVCSRGNGLGSTEL